MLIYSCLSSHGFGHAARHASVLAELHRLSPGSRLVVSTAVDPSFLGLVFRGLPVELRRCRWDVGMVQSDALGTDPEATLAALADLHEELPDQIAAEAAWLAGQSSPVLIVGDVPPAAASLAERLRVPLVWMANFGWDEIYAPLGGAFSDYAQAAAEAYSRGDLLLRCPFSLAMPWGLREISIGLTASQPRPLPRSFEQALSTDARPRVFVGFGGLGFALDDRLLRGWSSHRFVLSEPALASERERLAACSNVLLLPEGVRPLDLLPHCERHLGKPGYSSFCEALSSDVGLHVVRRSGFAEATALMDGLQRHGRHRILSRHQLETGDWQLDQPLHPAKDGPLANDGAAVAAQAILDCCGG